MRPRLVLDIGWVDLLHASASSFAGGRARRARAIEERSGVDVLVALSARSALDLYLGARAFPAGSEVLVSALTIADMTKVLAAHGLVPVPVDLDPATLAPARGALERARTERTRAVLVAHLFGARFAVDEILDFARASGLEVWEDGAQAHAADGWRGHPGSDLVLWSFGTIKTATALGGALARVRDPRVRARMRELEAAWPVQERPRFVQKIGKSIVLKVLGTRALFTLFAHALELVGKDRDAFLHGIVRGFPGPDLMPAIRKRPGAPLLALLGRRLASDTRARVELRRRAGEALERSLPAGLSSPGARASVKTYWVFAVRAAEPDRLVARLRAAGFDATRRSSLRVVAAPEGRAPASAAAALLEEIVFVPLVPPEARDFPRLVRALAEPEVELASLELVPVRRRTRGLGARRRERSRAGR